MFFKTENEDISISLTSVSCDRRWRFINKIDAKIAPWTCQLHSRCNFKVIFCIIRWRWKHKKTGILFIGKLRLMTPLTPKPPHNSLRMFFLFVSIVRGETHRACCLEYRGDFWQVIRTCSVRSFHSSFRLVPGRRSRTTTSGGTRRFASAVASRPTLHLACSVLASVGSPSGRFVSSWLELMKIWWCCAPSSLAGRGWVGVGENPDRKFRFP